MKTRLQNHVSSLKTTLAHLWLLLLCFDRRSNFFWDFALSFTRGIYLFCVAFSSWRLLLRALPCSGLGCGAGRKGRKELGCLIWSSHFVPYHLGAIILSHCAVQGGLLQVIYQLQETTTSGAAELDQRLLCHLLAWLPLWQHSSKWLHHAICKLRVFPFYVICCSWLKCQCFCGCFNLPMQHRALGMCNRDI